MQPEEFDLDLSDGHWLQWTQYDGQRCGGIIYHLTTKTQTGMCAASFWIAGSKALGAFPNRPVWTFTGGDKNPTMSPSFRCHCGDHGWIRKGKWVRG